MISYLLRLLQLARVGVGSQWRAGRCTRPNGVATSRLARDRERAPVLRRYPVEAHLLLESQDLDDF